MSLYPGSENDAEPPYTPLGLAPYERDENGETEYMRTMAAIHESFERSPDLPSNVRAFGELALVQFLNEQTLRNTVSPDAPLSKDVKRSRLAPDQLVELMIEHKFLRAVELARLTHIGEFDIDEDFHNPVRDRLLGNTAIGSQIVNESPIIKPKYHPETNVLSIDMKQKVMTHFNGSMGMYYWSLMAIDLEDNKSAELFYDFAIDLLYEESEMGVESGEKNQIWKAKGQKARRVIGDIVPSIIAARSRERFPYAYPMQSTLFELVPERLEELDPIIRKQTPNLIIA